MATTDPADLAPWPFQSCHRHWKGAQYDAEVCFLRIFSSKGEEFIQAPHKCLLPLAGIQHCTKAKGESHPPKTAARTEKGCNTLPQVRVMPGLADHTSGLSWVLCMSPFMSQKLSQAEFIEMVSPTMQL